MRLLEAELRFKLFHRHGHGVELTNEGMAFLDRCQHVLNDFEQLRNDFRSHRSGKVVMGNVCIGLPVPATRFATPRLLATAREAHPGLSVRFVEGFSTLLHEWLLSGSLDLAILFEPRTSKILSSTPLLFEDLFAVSAAKYAPKNPKFIEAQDLSSTTLILPHRPHVLRDLVDGLHLPRESYMEIDSTSLMIELARTGNGTTILPRGSVESALRSGNLVALPIVNPTLSWQVSVCYSNVRPLSLGAKVMLNLMRKEITQKVISGEWGPGRLIRSGTDQTAEGAGDYNNPAASDGSKANTRKKSTRR